VLSLVVAVAAAIKSGQVKRAMYCGDSAGFPAETVFDITA
jgi:hypothetical protein